MAFDQSATEGSPVHDLRIPAGRDKDLWPSYVDELLGYLRSTKLGHEYHWREALLFLTDEQWIRWVSTTQTFRRHSLEGWIPTPVTNYIQKIYDRLVDMVTSGELLGAARPASDRHDDISRAKAASRVMRHLFVELETGDCYEEAALWLVATGSCALFANYDVNAAGTQRVPKMVIEEKPAYETVAVDPLTDETFPVEFVGQQNPENPAGGVLQEDRRVMVDPETQEPIMDVTRKQARDPDTGELLFDEFKEGQVAEEAENMFGFFPQPRARWKDVDYCCKVSAVTPDEVVSMFGTKWRDKIVPEDINILGWGSYLSSQHGAVMMRHTGEAKEFSLLKFFRHVPSDKFKDGKLVITVGDNLCYEGPIDTLKTYDGKLPWQFVPYRKIPGELWGHGPMRTAIPQQKRVNSCDSSIIHNRKTMINPRWSIPNRSGVQTVEGKPGAIIRWDPQHLPRGVEPKIIPGIPLPASVGQERESTLRDMEDTTGVQEVLSGQQPTGVDTLGQHQLILEQATKRFTPLVKRWKRALARHEEHKLRIASVYWTRDREIRVIGEDNVVELYQYRGADLGSGIDVFIEMESEVIYSRAMQEQKIMMLADKGWLGDPRSPETQMKVLMRLNVPGFKNEFTVDAERARRNIHKIVHERDFDVRPIPFDNHPVHYKILTDHIKSQEFDSYDAQVKNALMQLAMAYQTAMEQQAQKAQQAAQASKGVGPEAERQVVDSGAFGNGAQAQTVQ